MTTKTTRARAATTNAVPKTRQNDPDDRAQPRRRASRTPSFSSTRAGAARAVRVVTNADQATTDSPSTTPTTTSSGTGASARPATRRTRTTTGRARAATTSSCRPMRGSSRGRAAAHSSPSCGRRPRVASATEWASRPERTEAASPTPRAVSRVVALVASMSESRPRAEYHDPLRANPESRSDGMMAIARTTSARPQTGPGLRRKCLTAPSSRSPVDIGRREMIPGLWAVAVSTWLADRPTDGRRWYAVVPASAPGAARALGAARGPPGIPGTSGGEARGLSRPPGGR